jgi:hypothetical protein
MTSPIPLSSPELRYLELREFTLASRYWAFAFAFPAAVATETRYRDLYLSELTQWLASLDRAFAHGAGERCLNLPQLFRAQSEIAPDKSNRPSLRERRIIYAA